MMLTLVAELATRRRWYVAFNLVAIAGLWWMWWALAENENALMPFGFTMGMAFMLGPALTLRYMPRPVWYLPLSRSQIWRAGWLFATAGATLVTTAGKLIAMLLHRGSEPGGVSSVALSSTYDFAYCGIGCAVVALATRPRPSRTPWRQLSGVAAGAGDMIVPLASVFAFYGIQALRLPLPLRWSDLTPVSGGILIAALGLTAASYFHSPVPARAVAAAGSPRADKAPRRVDRAGLSGLPRLLVHEYCWSLGVGAALGIGSLLVVLIGAHTRSPRELAAFLRTELLVLDGASAGWPGGGTEPVTMLVLFACFAAALAARFSMMMRHLRVLPLGTRQLNALLLAWPLGIWSSVWMVFAALYSAVLGEFPHSFHLPVFVALAGSTALVRALSLRLSGAQNAIAFSALAVVVPLLLLVPLPPAWALIVIGAGGLAAAIALNRAALKQPATYRHSFLPIALPLTR
jgi:hypothetical protein